MTARRGVFWASVSYIFWGITPIYWKLLKEFSATELAAHRIIWSAVCLAPLYFRHSARRELGRVLSDGKGGIGLLIAAAFLIGYNWYCYVLAMVSGRVLASSLGYFMTPLMSVAVGLLLLRERLTRPQIVAVLLATLGVLFFAINMGHFPTLALILSGTFAFYGYLKKKVNASGALSVSIETTVLAPVALVFLYLHGMGTHSWQSWVTLMASGPLTAIPLIWYAWAVQGVPFLVVGFLQYISPIIQFVLAVYVYHEPFGDAQKLTFALIWLALGIFTWDLWRRLSRKSAS